MCKHNKHNKAETGCYIKKEGNSPAHGSRSHDARVPLLTVRQTGAQALDPWPRAQA